LARDGAKLWAKQALVRRLVASAKSRRLDADLIAPLLTEVGGPADPSATIDGPRALLTLQAQWAAITRFDTFTDAHFEWARAITLYGQAQVLRRPPSAGSFDFEYATNHACQDVLFALGMSVAAPSPAATPDALDIGPWLEGRAHLETSATINRSALLLPPGVPDGRLHVEVSIRIDQRET
jgi:hypothetical protein